MLIIGLTGSIAMGKSTACKYLQGKGLPVWSADEAVHELYRGKAAIIVEAVFPGTTDENGVNRERLSRYLMKFPRALGELEAIIHPLVEREREAFVAHQQAQGSERVVLDIPLLFENGLEDRVDVVLLVTAPADVQRQRAMERPGMTDEKLALILANQMSDEEKRHRADFIIDTSGTFEETRAKLDSFLESVHHRV